MDNWLYLVQQAKIPREIERVQGDLETVIFPTTGGWRVHCVYLRGVFQFISALEPPGKAPIDIWEYGGAEEIKIYVPS